MNVFSQNLFLGVADLYLFVALFSCLYFKFWLEAMFWLSTMTNLDGVIDVLEAQ